MTTLAHLLVALAVLAAAICAEIFAPVLGYALAAALILIGIAKFLIERAAARIDRDIEETRHVHR